MATSYKTPGVYVEEISKLPPSVAQVETAIPAFIGYTEKNVYNGLSLLNKPTRIKSLKEYEDIFGFAQSAVLTITLNADNTLNGDVVVSALTYRMYYALQLYFANGGGPCYITSVATYTTAGANEGARYTQMNTGLVAVGKEDEPTMLLFPDAPLLVQALISTDDETTTPPKATNYHQIYKDALQQSATLMDRVAVMDVFQTLGTSISLEKQSLIFRNGVGNNFLSYGAAYYPWLRTTLTPYVNEELSTSIAVGGLGSLPASPMLKKEVNGVGDPASIYHINSKLYFEIKKSLAKNAIIMPPSSAIAGVYAMVDSTRGVWKAPANVSLSMVSEPLFKVDDVDQRDMNVSDTGKSINAIRMFSGKGILVWGARTLAGNDNEWRYISVRRFYNMVEESVKKASEPFVFEPNDANTWAKVKGMIENFLTLQWRAGALMGDKPDEAFFVHVGLGETMTALDIFEGRMIVEIGMAAVRPAEFIILRFSHKMLETS